DRDSGHAQLVDAALPGGRFAVDVPGEGLLDLRVVDSGVGECGRAGFARHVRVVPVAPARLVEVRHPGADHEYPAPEPPSVVARFHVRIPSLDSAPTMYLRRGVTQI